VRSCLSVCVFVCGCVCLCRDFISENNAKHWRMGRQVQGVLNLIDNRLEDGGFQCVPMRDPVEWLRRWSPDQKWSTPSEPNGRYFFTPKSYEELGIPATRVPCPAGTLILFDACLPHGTLPNRSGRPRAIQFLRYIPKSTFSEKCVRLRTAAVRMHCKRIGFVPSREEAEVL
jgi:ectoine hydroxylase-related dioxygenase (phytanoyl-CoA dioxygenase family)